MLSEPRRVAGWPRAARRVWPRLAGALLAVGILGLGLGLRCAHHREVFTPAGVFFADGDCYARMTRARMIREGGGGPVRRHDFENHPAGVSPHTTAPLDYLIVGLAAAGGVWSREPLDWAGAWVSPLLGLAGGLFLWGWSGGFPVRFRLLMLLLYAVSPVLVHGQRLGRPDHQSLLLLLLAVALGAEWRLAWRPSRGWGMAGGAAWGVALWVSLYEPLVLLAGCAFLWLLCGRGGVRWRGRREWWIAAGAVLPVAWLVEGMRLAPPQRGFELFFPRWTATIGEMLPVPAGSPLWWQWLGLGCVGIPALLAFRAVRQPRLWAALLMLLLAGALTCAQARWGYFFALIAAMSVPWALGNVRGKLARAGVWCGALLALWPVWREWDRELYSDRARKADSARALMEALYLRQTALWLRDRPRGAVLSTWWWSPALAYWSRQPAVAGSSHEALPGTVESALVLLSTHPAQARELLAARGVRYVVVGPPELALPDCERLVGTRATPASLGSVLYRAPSHAPWFLEGAHANAMFRVFRVRE